MRAEYTRTHVIIVAVSYVGKHARFASISEDLGEARIQSEDPLLLIPLLRHPSTRSGDNPTPTLSHQHPHPAGAPTAWQCQLSARETTGGIWRQGPQITEQLKIDPGNGDVAFPNPLTCNPSHICLFCLDCFTRGKMRTL